MGEVVATDVPDPCVVAHDTAVIEMPVAEVGGRGAASPRPSWASEAR